MRTTTTAPFAVFLVDDDEIFLSPLIHKVGERFKSKIDITIFFAQVFRQRYAEYLI